jgi:hypothetical protein
MGSCFSVTKFFGISALALVTVGTGLAQSNAGFKENPGLADAVARATRGFTATDSLSGAPAYSAVSPSQRYRIGFSDQADLKLTVGSNRLAVRVVAYGAGSDRGFLGKAQPWLGKDAEGWPSIGFRRSGLSEWYVNGDAGLQQWIQIATRPSASAGGNLWVRLGLLGASQLRAISEDSVQMRVGNTSMIYGGLKVWDARGRELDARLQSAGDAINMVINDRDAVYPVTIDPTWSQQQQLVPADGKDKDSFGYAVAVSGNTAAVSSVAKDLEAGGVYIFERSGNVWSQTGTVLSPSTSSGDFFGTSLSLNGDDLLVGAPEDNNLRGAALYFRRDAATFDYVQTLVAPDGNIGDEFGASLGIDGAAAAVGAPSAYSNRGGVYVYRKSGDKFVYEATVRPSEQERNERFGRSTAISGDTIVAGSPFRTVYGRERGVAFAFVKTGANWIQQRKFSANGGTDQDRFGWSAAIQGDRAVFGAPNAQFTTGNGAAYVFDRTGTNWVQSQRVVPLDHALDSDFGYSVALTDTALAVGAPRQPNPGTKILPSQGAVYAFTFSGGKFVHETKAVAADRDRGSRFGDSVALSADTMVIGAPFKNLFGVVTGAAYVFSRLDSATLINGPTTFPIGGKTAQLTCTLSSPAPAGGLVMALTSDSSLYQAPATITIPEGQTSVTVPVKTLSTPVDVPVTLVGKAAGYADTIAEFEVRYPRCGKIEFDPSATNPGGKLEIKEGETATGVVTIQAPAPVGGSTIQLQNLNAVALDAPTSVFIPQGQSRVSFTVTGRRVTTNTVVKLVGTPSFNEVSGSITVLNLADLASLTVADAVILRGGETTGTVKLKQVAGPAGQTVDLVSNTAEVEVPARITVPAGESSYTFPIKSVGTTGVRATITAEQRGTNLSVVVTVQRPVLSTVTVSPNTVKAGSPSVATVTLSDVAPKGVLVELKSSKPTIGSVPATVLVPAGQKSVTAPITTFTGVTADVTITISGRLPGDGYVGDKLTVTK